MALIGWVFISRIPQQPQNIWESQNIRGSIDCKSTKEYLSFMDKCSAFINNVNRDFLNQYSCILMTVGNQSRSCATALSNWMSSESMASPISSKSLRYIILLAWPSVSPKKQGIRTKDFLCFPDPFNFLSSGRDCYYKLVLHNSLLTFLCDRHPFVGRYPWFSIYGI